MKREHGERVRAVDLVLDESIYPRHGIDDTHVRQLAEARRAGIDLPPVVVQRHTNRVVDGFHRIAAELREAGEEALISVEWRDYPSDAALFADAMLLNSRHGQVLATYDRVRCIALARQLGIPDIETAARLQITVETVERLILTRTAIGPEAALVPLKFTAASLAGRELTGEQFRANDRASGMSVLFSVNQVLNAISGDLLDWRNEALVGRLETLREVLNRVLDERLEPAV
jgi:hypothetical protein